MAALVARIGIRLLALLPLNAARWLGASVASLLWVFGAGGKRITRRNLKLCFPDLSEAERERLGRQSLAHTGRLVAETGMCWHWPEARWQRTIESVQGEQLVSDGLASGDGVLLLVPHIGNWEVVALYLGRYRLHALYDPPRLAGLDRALRRARNRGGAQLFPIDKRGILSVVRALRDGRLVGLLPDQVPDREAGVYVPFFGERALTMTLAQRLAKRSRARLVLGWGLRTSRGFSIGFEPLPDTLRSDNPGEAAAAMNREIERLVTRHPAQYQWEYKRFKRQPRGERNVYKSG